MLSVLFLVTVVSFSLLFLILSLCHRIDADTISSIRVSPLLPSFLDTFSLVMSSIGCKVSCVLVSFQVLWSICWSNSLVHFKNSPEYLTRRQPFDEISAAKAWFREVFSYEILFLIFLSSPLIFPSTCKFPFLQTFWFFLNLIVLFLLSFVFFRSTLLLLFFYAKFHPCILTVYSYCFY